MSTNIKNSLKNNWEILDWDSDFFEFLVAQITKEDLNSKEFIDTLSEIKDKKVKLLYWSFAEDNITSQEIANSNQGELVDLKTTFTRTLEGFEPIWDKNISEYTKTKPEKKLIDLAIQSGIYSRFNKDKKIGKSKFEELYELWISNSVNKKLADIVFVSTHDDEISGFVTVKKDGNNSIIGLIAVDTKHRGKKIGTSLVNAALSWAKENACTSAQVGTQKENIPACKLYEKCGYKIESVKQFYHFWLK